MEHIPLENVTVKLRVNLSPNSSEFRKMIVLIEMKASGKYHSQRLESIQYKIKGNSRALSRLPRTWLRFD